jgi:hypothetical protein
MSEKQSLSEQLRRAREQQGRSIEDVYRKTGISHNVLLGLENGRFDVVEPVFVRLALRTYAEDLGLDPNAVVEQYDRTHGPALAPPAPSAVPIQPAPRSAAVRILGLAAALLAVLLLAFFFLFGGQDEEETKAPSLRSGPGLAPPPTPAPAGREAQGQRLADLSPRPESGEKAPPVVEFPDASPDTLGENSSPSGRDIWTFFITGGQDSVAADSLAAPGLDSLARAAADSPAAPGLDSLARAVADSLARAAADTILRLDLEAVDSTWVQIRWDGNGIFEGVVPKGERQSWEANRYFLVHAARTYGLRYWFRNQPLNDSHLGDPSKPLYFRASRRGITLLGADLQPLFPADGEP